MSFWIKSIIVYSHDGESNNIDFTANGLNIVTGASKTGKSSLIDIIEYCFGRETCNVSEGVIRRSVSWYGILLDRGDKRIFIARRNPKPPRTRDPDVFLALGKDLVAPPFETLQSNFSVDGIEKLLTTSVGISENQAFVPDGQTRIPLKANIKHALMFCLQDQDEIDSRKVLFHRQSEPFLPQSIKDVLPYFLGAIDENSLRMKIELDAESKELRRLEKIGLERENVSNASLSRTEDIYREAQFAGLIADGPVPAQDEAIRALRAVDHVVKDIAVPPDHEEHVEALRQERISLRRELSIVRERLRQVRYVEDVAGGFAVEAGEQRARLASLGLANMQLDHSACVLCGTSDINAPVVAEMRKTFDELDQQLGQVQRDVPRLQAAQAEHRSRLAFVEQSLRRNHEQLEVILRQDERFDSEVRWQIGSAQAIGRISYFLETLPVSSAIKSSSEDLDRVRRRVAALQDLIDPEEIAERVASILNIVGDYMTHYAQSLELEHSGSRLRLDIRHLTVVADTVNGPIPLQRMGSGENWVGYHVLAHLALHKWFREQKRPVPSFLFFDQPSQAHYPSEKDDNGSVDSLADEDRRAVYKLFELIWKVGKDLSPNFQIIIADHADLRDDWFSDAVVVRWRGNGLIPAGWRTI